MPMQKYSCYLQSSQIEFLRSITDTSSFVREALTVAIANEKRASAEKTIAIFGAIQELETKFSKESAYFERVRQFVLKNKYELENAIVTRKVANGEFRVIKEEDEDVWIAIVETPEHDFTEFAEGNTEEEAKERALQKGKKGLAEAEKVIERLEPKKANDRAFLEAVNTKIEEIKANLGKALDAMEEHLVSGVG